MALENEISDWRPFVKSLSSIEDIEAFEQLMDACRSHASAGSNAVRPVVFKAMAMSILLHQQKMLDRLEKEVNSLTKKNTLASPE